MRGVSDFRGELDPAVDGPWVHDERNLFESLQAVHRNAVAVVVLADGWKKCPVHALVLHAEHVGHVGPCQGIVDVGNHFDSELVNRPRNQSGRTAHCDVRSQFLQSKDVAERHPRVQDVTYNDDVLAFEASDALLHGKCVQKGLGGVLVGAVAGVDDVCRHAIRQKLRNPRVCMANDHDVHFHREDVVDGVGQGFALFYRRIRGREVHDVC